MSLVVSSQPKILGKGLGPKTKEPSREISLPIDGVGSGCISLAGNGWLKP